MGAYFLRSRGETSTFVIDGSTCLAAPRFKLGSGGSRRRGRDMLGNPQILVATQVLKMACFMCSPHDDLSELILESIAKSKNHHHSHYGSCSCHVFLRIPNGTWSFGSRFLLVLFCHCCARLLTTKRCQWQREPALCLPPWIVQQA